MSGKPKNIQIFSWDWKESPDFAEIGPAITEVSGGTVFITEVETGSDQFAIVVSSSQLTAEQAAEAYQEEWGAS